MTILREIDHGTPAKEGAPVSLWIDGAEITAVSYTHLTLPTIYSV